MDIIGDLKLDFTSEEGILELQRNIKSWFEHFLKVYQAKDVTPYIHALCYHVPEFLSLYFTKAFSLFHEQVGHGTILFYPLESFPREWTAFRCEQTENIQILYRPWRVSIHRSMCYSQRNEFSTSLVDFVNLPDLNIIQFCIFLLWIRLSNGGLCQVFVAKSLCFFYFPL